MAKGIGCVVVLVVVLLVVGLAVMGTNNRLVGLEQGVDSQWAQVENAYQRRADLIPNLVASVRGAAEFEKSTLQEITEARASCARASRSVMSSSGWNPQIGASIASAAWTSTRTSPVCTGMGKGSAGGRPGPNRPSTNNAHTFPNVTRPTRSSMSTPR